MTTTRKQYSRKFKARVALESNKFGRYYKIRGTLTGPNGVMLAVRAIWMTEHFSGVTKFVTLIPDKRSE